MFKWFKTFSRHWRNRFITVPPSSLRRWLYGGIPLDKQGAPRCRAGETPEMREACPTLKGRSFFQLLPGFDAQAADVVIVDGFWDSVFLPLY